MPSIVDCSPLVIAVSTGGASPILGRMLKARLESMIPSAYGRLAELMSRFRGRVAAAIPSQTMRRRFWEGVLDGPIAEALTHRDHAQTCVFVTGHGKDGHVDLDWKSLVQPNQTVAVYMGLRNLETLTQEFIVRGARADMPAAIVDNATRVNQRVIVGTLQSLPGLARSAKLRGPSILIIGTVVTLRGRLTGDSARDASRDLGNSTFAGEIPAPVEVCEI